MSLSKPSKPFNRIHFGLATLSIMVDAFEKAFDPIVKKILEAHFTSNPPEPPETWMTKCKQNFGRAMEKNFQLIKNTPAKVTPSKKKPVKADANDDGKTTRSEKADEEDVAKLPQWDTYIICTLLKAYLQTVS